MNANQYLPLCLTLMLGGAPRQLPETLVVNSYGGPYEAIIEERIIKPFEEKTGIDVVYDAVGSTRTTRKSRPPGANPASTWWS